jgi:hypothetical protein
VSFYASFNPGSFARVFWSVLFYSLTVQVAVLASSYIPGYKLALVSISIVILMVSFLPVVFYMLFDAD